MSVTKLPTVEQVRTIASNVRAAKDDASAALILGLSLVKLAQDAAPAKIAVLDAAEGVTK